MLVCSRRCGGQLFRALFAEVEMDSTGSFQDYRLTQPGYVCLNCGSPALDLAEVPKEMDAEAEAEEAASITDVLCPVCETLVQLAPGMDCPNCGAPLEAV